MLVNPSKISRLSFISKRVGKSVAVDKIINDVVQVSELRQRKEEGKQVIYIKYVANR